jgi:hypothetical protein
MKRKKLNVCYNGSGVKSLRRWAKVLIVLSIIAIIPTLIGLINLIDNSSRYNYDFTGDLIIILFGLLVLLLGCILAPALKGLAIIAETALINKHIMMNEYNIVDSSESDVDFAHELADITE